MNKPIKLLIALASIVIVAATILFMVWSRPTGPTIRVLFIGNSFTSTNDLPKTFAFLAASLGAQVIYDMAAPGGYTLQQHSSDQTTLAKINLGTWDYVVLQEQSELPAVAPASVAQQVTPPARQLSQLISSANPQAQVVFYETWGYKNGDQTYCSSVSSLCSYDTMQARLNYSYGQLAAANSALLAPVGEAWAAVRSAHPEIELYQSDGKHPSAAGTYLAACVFYVTLFKKSAVGAANLGLDRATAKALQTIASQTVLNQ
jgi:lysophospholipase L1-like esterase